VLSDAVEALRAYLLGQVPSPYVVQTLDAVLQASPRAARAVESQSESFTKSLSGVTSFVLEV
jgi:hypothetical protein